MDRLGSLRSDVLGMVARHDAAHDASHIMRVYKNAELLCREEGVDPELVLASALLHDIIQFKKSDPKSRDASAHSAKKAEEILQKHGYGADEIQVVADAIRDHSFSRGVVPVTYEGRILQDADRLDAMGAIGIARAFSVGGSEDRPLYNPDDPFCRIRHPDDRRWTVDHFYKKLFKLEGLMNTDSGRLIARDRTRILREFLEHLDDEIS